jgi:hypothetical protein
MSCNDTANVCNGAQLDCGENDCEGLCASSDPSRQVTVNCGPNICDCTNTTCQ